MADYLMGGHPTPHSGCPAVHTQPAQSIRYLAPPTLILKSLHFDAAFYTRSSRPQSGEPGEKHLQRRLNSAMAIPDLERFR